MEVPPPPVESAGCVSPGRPVGLPPELVPADVPLDPGSGVPLQVSFFRSELENIMYPDAVVYVIELISSQEPSSVLVTLITPQSAIPKKMTWFNDM